ncbi:hypothetical protein PIB30_069288 [Stylosanthes scabra]|uniref:FAS1 domain-containing protein n=1 Tax=Stylosanthes scabra TaxID=79078 RepID=A0ABU6ZME6_9FABA|nr:hypothetical protein [Stylosanthes scabra]
MASSLSLSFLLLFSFSVISLSTALPSEAISDAADILADSNFVSMALTLEILAESLLEQPSSATVFAPSDSAFKKSGQPSLDLLRFHFAPLPLPPQSLRLLTAGAKIPSMLPGQSLVVTASPSDRIISLNNVRITESPLYDDGVLLVYGVDRFLDPNFQDNSGSNQKPNSNATCIARNLTANNSSDSFSQAIETLKSGGYSAMAAFLAMQLAGLSEQNAITILAPPDEMVLNQIREFGEYPSFFLRHAVPCRLLWNDLVNLEDNTLLPTFVEGFGINITRSGGVLNLNGVTVFFPDLFSNDKVVVHGVSDVVALQDSKMSMNETLQSSLFDYDGFNSTDDEIMFDPGEF